MNGPAIGVVRPASLAPMRSEIFKAIPDWIEFTVILLLLPVLARSAVKERSRLTAIQADESQTEDERAKASKRLSRQRIAAPVFVAMMVALIGSYILRFTN